MERFTKIDRKATRTYWLVVATTIVMVSLGAGIMIYRDFENRFRSTGQQLMSTAQAIAEHTTQAFTKLNALSNAIIEDMTDKIVSEELLSEVMRRRAFAEPAARGIVIVDKSGRVYSSGVDDYPVGKDLSATDDFMVLSSSSAPDFSIGKPFRSRHGIFADADDLTMTYSRRFNGEDGSFNGYVLIFLEPTYLYGFYSEIDKQSGTVVGLMGTDGTILLSSSVSVVGQNVASYIPEELVTGRGVRINPSVRSGIERIFAYYRSSAAPLIAYVGAPTSPIYMAWLAASSVIVAALLALFVALVTIGIFLGKYTQNRISLIQAMLDAVNQRRDKEFLETIVNTGGVLMAVTDTDGRFVVANQAMHELFPDIERRKTEVGAISDSLGEAFTTVLESLPWQSIQNIVLADGRRRALSWSVSPIKNSNGEVKNLVAVGLDITEQRDAELAIYQAGKLVTLGEVATGIAHEINQPLAALAMAVDNLHARVSNGNFDQAMIVNSLELASDQIDRAANIVRHMRIYSHRSDLSLQPVDPATALEGALTIAGAQFAKEKIAIRRCYKTSEYCVLADLVLVEQIILNLLLNARDAIIEQRSNIDGATDDHIEIRFESALDDMIAIVVADSGPGIKQANFDHLFEPFFTTKPIGKGTGLGLSLGYGMARDMGGSLDARNGVKGAEFRLVLRDAKSCARTEGNE